MLSRVVYDSFTAKSEAVFFFFTKQGIKQRATADGCMQSLLYIVLPTSHCTARHLHE